MNTRIGHVSYTERPSDAHCLKAVNNSKFLPFIYLQTAMAAYSFSGRTLFCDGTNREPEVAAGAVRVEIGRTEVQVPRAARAIRIEGRRPIAAVGPGTSDGRTVPVADRRKKDTVSILLTGYFVPILSALCRPCVCTVRLQLVELSLRGHTPPATPICTSGIVRQIQTSLVVN